ncbi:MAG: hypothetical protein AAF382_18340 [Pseudomonadota bacterium]
MNSPCSKALLVSAFLTASATMVQAQGLSFSWEGELEVGVESVLDSNVPGNEVDDPFLTFEQVGELSFGENFSIIGGLTIEEMTGPSSGIQDLGLYVDTLVFQAMTERFVFQLGKSEVAFGDAWNSAAGYFGSTIAEDYELTEQLGLFAEISIGQDSTLAAGAFYADNTSLSESFGFNRGQNSTAAGGAGNTGELDNFSLQFTQEVGNAFFHVGARHLSKGTGDVSDETGFVAGGGYSFAESGTPLDLFVEIAAFDGFGGSADDAVYATLTAAFGITDSTELSAGFIHRDIDTVGDTNLFTIGIDHELENGVAVGAGLGVVDDAGADETIFGASIVIPLG